MITSRRVRLTLFAVCLSLASLGAWAQAQPKKDFEPHVGQEGKDVVWVPTSQALVDKMLDLAKVKSSDYVIDLGSGDGRTVITAAKRGARALGIEYNPSMVELAKRNAEKEGVAGKAQFRKADLFETDLSEATVITMFLLPTINMKLRPKLLDLKPGTRIVSNSFTMEDWKADETATAERDCTSYCTAYFWIVPAKVAGTWSTPQGELTLKQEFQHFNGTLKGKESLVVTNGNLLGDQVSFTAGNTRYQGTVNGRRIEGTATSGGMSSHWIATH
ncbi:MAG TPA: class I SAM-dependent methyltransferase [Burkholderiales bacterium]